MSYNTFSKIDFHNTKFTNVKIDNNDYSNKNVLIIKDDLTNIPVASNDNLDVTFLYVGTSTDNYKNNTIYKCVYKSTDDTYSWKLLSIGTNIYYGTTEPTDDDYSNGDYFFYYIEEEQTKEGSTEKIKVNTLKKILVKADDKWITINPPGTSLFIANEVSSISDIKSVGTYKYTGQLGTLEEYTTTTWMITVQQIGTTYMYHAISTTDTGVQLYSSDGSTWNYAKTGWWS